MPRADLNAKLFKDARAVAGADRTIYWDERMPGFGLMVTARGHKSFIYQYRINGSSRRLNLDGKFLRLEAEREAQGTGKLRAPRKPAAPLEAARREAVKVESAIIDGRDPLQECRKVAAASTLRTVAEEYLRREGRKLRSYSERKRIFERYVYPRLGSGKIDDIRRSDIVNLLDRIEDQSGPVQAHAVLAAIRKLFNWHAKRSDVFRSPIVRGMSPALAPKLRARERKLDDHELQAVWRAAEGLQTPYGYLCRFLLLTAARLREGAHMARGEVSADGREWTIPAKRSKSKQPCLLPLSQAAQNLLAQVPSIGRTWVFTYNGAKPVNSFNKGKATLDARVLEVLREHDPDAKQLPRWTWHDLRRTARSLMSRAGVPSRHAEMALGHAVAGVESTYDRHDYLPEMRAAFEALAGLIDRILKPTSNVVDIGAARLVNN